MDYPKLNNRPGLAPTESPQIPMAGERFALLAVTRKRVLVGPGLAPQADAGEPGICISPKSVLGSKNEEPQGA